MLEHFLWRVDYDAKRDRLLRATRDVKTGQCVFCKRAYGNVILSTYRAALCAVCLRAAAADICCDDCSTVFFLHSQDQDRRRLAASLDPILAACSLDAADGKLHADDEGIVRASYANVKNLVHVLNKEGGLWVDHINENSYSLDALDETHLVAVVGLFSICGLANHNCQPNCTWSNAGDSVLEVRALRDINEGEELTLSYIYILCAAPLSESVDRFLEGFCCPTCSSKAVGENECLLAQVEDKLLCSNCQFDVPRTVMASAVLTVRAKLASAKLYLNQFRYVDVVAELGDVLRGINANGQVIPFHPSHGVAIALTRLFSLCPGRYYLPLALAHFDYPEALRRMLVDPTIPVSENLDRDELQREMRASYQAFSDICAVRLGKPHPLRHRAVACLKY
ncbi:unnamed protein product [Peronospora destructor]|uniref:SET domain-containing protein n=1 Tax=Peronospora destructor TaxID=86335 RepID=A0AAV0TIS6_9STRA|nr:unnamed protein product [Peronospora destructor]